MMDVEPTQEHRWLQKLIGEWTHESFITMEPGQPSAKFSGVETVRSLGEVWVTAQGEGEMPGGGVGKTMMTLGYDPEKRRFVGTWIGSMMTYLWVYDGALDAAGKSLTLETEAPDPESGGKVRKFQDIITFMNDDERTLVGRAQNDDGSWRELMTVHYRRKA